MANDSSVVYRSQLRAEKITGNFTSDYQSVWIPSVGMSAQNLVKVPGLNRAATPSRSLKKRLHSLKLHFSLISSHFLLATRPF